MKRSDIPLCLAMAAVWTLGGYYSMKDDQPTVAREERAAMVMRAAENNCAGQVVMSAGRLRCAGPDATGTMVARLVEVRQ